MKILGIDPGFGLCGFAVLEKNKSDLDLITFGVIKTAPRSNFSDRLLEIADDFQKILKKHRPDIVSIEDLFFVKNVSTGIRVAEVRGILLFLAHKFGAKIVEPKPSEIKNCFCGNGRATKSEIKKMTKIIFNLDSAPQIDDAADAVAAAFFASQNAKFMI